MGPHHGVHHGRRGNSIQVQDQQPIFITMCPLAMFGADAMVGRGHFEICHLHNYTAW